MGGVGGQHWHCTMARHMNIHYSFCQTSFSFGEIHQLILSLLQDMNQILKSTGPKSFYGINQNVLCMRITTMSLLFIVVQSL